MQAKASLQIGSTPGPTHHGAECRVNSLAGSCQPCWHSSGGPTSAYTYQLSRTEGRLTIPSTSSPWMLLKSESAARKLRCTVTKSPATIDKAITGSTPNYRHGPQRKIRQSNNSAPALTGLGSPIIFHLPPETLSITTNFKPQNHLRVYIPFIIYNAHSPASNSMSNYLILKLKQVPSPQDYSRPWTNLPLQGSDRH